MENSFFSIQSEAEIKQILLASAARSACPLLLTAIKRKPSEEASLRSERASEPRRATLGRVWF